MSRFMFRKFWILPAAIGLALSTSSVTAAPVQYQYSTAANPGGGNSGLFGSSAFVSGTFLYDSQAPQTGTTGSWDAAVYAGYDVSPGVRSSSFTELTGTVQGYGFSDFRGYTHVQMGWEPGSATITPLDYVALIAEMTVGNSLIGFDIGGYRLANVRLTWSEGHLGTPDFLENQDLPTVLPPFQGSLWLDFVPVSSPGGPVNFANSVFFDGLRVTLAAPIPEPEIYAMLGLGLGLMGWVGRRKKPRAA
jgi:PEP-CTERM motif